MAIAHKLLVGVCHALTKEVADRFSEPERAAVSFLHFANRVGVRNLPPSENGEKVSAIQYVRAQLDWLGIGAELETMKWGSKTFKLPPLTLSQAEG